MKDQATYSEVFARLAEIDAEFGTLCDERDRLRAAMRADGNKRARLAMTDAGFVFGESIISTARWNEQIGVLIKVQVQSSPWEPGTTWHFEVWYRSILKSGRLGQRLRYTGESVVAPEDLPSLFKITGTADKQKALNHPRIIRQQPQGSHP